ncbi:MAG TPA: hypothetical protein VJU87_04360, partial [Gemmatimonadaceae bacterium]|nr:hypothetical protein [Gemmatimonadaceae bacterium]
NAAGELTIALDEPNPFLQEALEGGRAELAGALRHWFPDIARVQVRAGGPDGAAAPRRLTDEMLRKERIAALWKRDPVLGAAIDALDLDVLD